jgi:hypothetical protein
MARESKLPKRLQPMLATLTDAPFDDPDWVFETKCDGFRMIACIDRGKVTLYSRNGNRCLWQHQQTRRPAYSITSTGEQHCDDLVRSSRFALLPPAVCLSQGDFRPAETHRKPGGD